MMEGFVVHTTFKEALFWSGPILEIVFIDVHPDCDIPRGSNGTVLGNGICKGGGYTAEECGYEYGDCDVGQIGGDMTFPASF